MRPGTIGKAEVLLLKKAGVELVYIGVEHGNQEFRSKVLRRNMSNKSIVETFDLLHEQAIACHANLLLGLPYETKEYFLETVRLSRLLGLKNDNPIGIFYPFPGTELGEACKKMQWMPAEKKYKDIGRATIIAPYFSRKEIYLCEQAFPIFLKYRLLPLRTLLVFLSVLAFHEKFSERIRGIVSRLRLASSTSQ